MFALGSLAFASPWLLAALAALPVIWWLLRVTPPAPRRVAFPAIRLLLGLSPREETPARTPWWLILLRTLIAALIVVALAHPVLNPQARLAGSGPVVLVIDDGWAAAHDWSRRQAAALDLLAEAAREKRQVVLVTTAPPESGQPAAPLAPLRAVDGRAAVEALQPKPWAGDRQAALARLKAMNLSQGTMAVWLSDGVADDGAAALARYLADRGSLRYVAAAVGDAPLLLAAGGAAGDRAAKSLGVEVRSLPAAAPRPVVVRASD
ncbi:MAG TPA: BatA domain-containing protein, partial [Stellaceae bacterium]|nr:BatA domain-containing protein [Stellaceae bacterium]